ncbi:uncharacterized protein LOC123566159 [Mercenaria mercenaria]|uniref:uncharacterized protein LOC123566159 n=1 Tax=Mercenaria mercenaria TaxID=6596 RepID=UPI00234F9293|nr:uncharacterized protein LOC123566159 [Mercenaria mercenaria]
MRCFPYTDLNKKGRECNLANRQSRKRPKPRKVEKEPTRKVIVISSGSEEELELPNITPKSSRMRSSQSETTDDIVTIQQSPVKGEQIDNIEHHMGDSSLPIFKNGFNKGLETRSVINTVLSSERDSQQFGHERDILCDGHGTWTQTSTKIKFFKRTGSKYEGSTESSYGKACFIKTRRMSFRHSSSPDFHRIVLYIWVHNGVNDAVHNIALVQYFFEGCIHPVTVPPHGNSKKGQPFHRTSESTKQAIKNKIKKERYVSPKNTVHDILNRKGGMENLQSPGPRNRKQISNFSYSDKSSNPVLELMEHCKMQSFTPTSVFVREVTTLPELSVFLASDQQLRDIKLFCTNPKEFSVLGVDATFNVGEYYLTLTTYRNLMLSNNKALRV